MVALKTKLPAIANACEKAGVKSLELFGSGARDDFHEDSDLDFLVEFKEPMLPGLLDRYLALHGELQEIFARNIDLVEASAVSNPVLLKRIDEERKLVYAA